jgi:ribosomal protein S18 acetylase RimI-like enzyme
MQARLDMARDESLLLVADGDPKDTEPQRVFAYGGSTRLDWGGAGRSQPDEGAVPHAPNGWYLSGVVVDSECRRAGIGRALTLARVAAWQQLESESRGQHLRYVVNALNRASIALRDSLGFELESKEFLIPGVTFSGGRGLLFRLRAEDSPMPSK